MARGQIRKALSGFYYVHSDGITYQTRGRGNFRVRETTPLVGDFVEFESNNLDEGILLAVDKRKNELVRPPIANVDVAVIVMSAIEPDFSTYLLDRFLVYLEGQGIDAIIYITKTDLLAQNDKDKIYTIQHEYQELGYTVLFSDYPEYKSIDQLLKVIGNHSAVFLGQSGVGKSSL